MIKAKGMCSISFRGLTVEELIEFIKENKLDSIEWGGDVHVPAGDIETAKRVKDLCEKAGVETSSYGSYFRVGVDADFEKVCKTAKALGTDVIRVWASDKDAEDFTEQEYIELVKALKDCAIIAKNYGQIIAFEYHYVTFCNKAEDILRLIKDCGMDNVYTYWQPAYWVNDYWQKGFSEEQRIEYNLSEIAKLKDKIVNVHVYSWRGQERFALSNDHDEWARYIKALPDVNGYMEFVKDNTLENFRLDAKEFLSL